MSKQRPSTTNHQPSTILLVGGGTGGHIFPLHPLAKELLGQGHQVHLIVNDSPLDKQVIADKFTDLKDLQVHYLRTYKIDYHLSFRNLMAPFKIIGSFLRTKNLLKNINPNTVFFKGGFVGFPVLIVLQYFKFLNHLPFTINHSPKVFLHDSDISAGALTRFIGKKADHIFTNFGQNPTPLFYWPANFPSPCWGESERGLKEEKKRPKILIFGGSQGAQFLNNLIVQNIGPLTKKCNITLVTGPKNRLETHFNGMPNFQHKPFMPQDDLIKAMLQSDVVIARSGASVFQVLAAKTKLICVPLPTSARNHQLHNAQYFANKGLCYVLEQNTQTNEKLLPMLEQVLADKELEQKLENYEGLPQVESIVEKITQ